MTVASRTRVAAHTPDSLKHAIRETIVQRVESRAREGSFAIEQRANASSLSLAGLLLGARACIKGGILSIPGVYAGFADKFPIGVIFGKGLTVKTGQTHVHRYLKPLLQRVENGEIDPSFVITHRFKLEDAPQAYKMFANRDNKCIKVVLSP